MSFVRILFLTLLFVWATNVQCQNAQIFDVKKYGAISDGKTENSNAFLLAWKDACQWNGQATVLVPTGEYVLDSVRFEGECRGYITFQLEGTLKALIKLKDIDQWVTFQHVNDLTLTGGGTFDGQGDNVWACRRNKQCKTLPISLRLEFVTNGKVNGIKSINSQNAHVSIFASRNLYLTDLHLSAPQDSPNTDGIKLSQSQDIRISHTSIGTGDDCVAILNGTANVNISQVFCGPGHGISVGSMGGNTALDKKDIVVGVTVRNCTFTNTSDGLRIKTWESPHEGVASGFTYEDIIMNDVGSPINIDQHYCPYPPCDTTTPSHIHIKDITYTNIRGTSQKRVAVSLNCTSVYPCENIVLKDINLVHHGDEGPAISFCSNAHGSSYGEQNPSSCLR